MNVNDYFKYKKRIVVKIGSSSLHHPGNGSLDLIKMEKLVRELCDLRNQGYDVCLVSSGAIAVGKRVIGLSGKPEKVETKQACASVGQARLMMVYQRLFSEYSQITSQILMTKNTIAETESRENAKNCFNELFRLGVIPVVNENDTVSTYEMHFGDNDTLSAVVAQLVDADLLILLSDIDGLYTDDPRINPDAELIERVDRLTEEHRSMAKETTGSDVGTGGMTTKIRAARIACAQGTDVVIANGKDVHILHEIMEGNFRGTLILGKKKGEKTAGADR